MTKDEAIEILELCLDGAEAAEAYWAEQEDHAEEVCDAAEEAEAYRMAIRALENQCDRRESVIMDLYGSGELSARAANCLLRRGWKTMEEVVSAVKEPDDLLMVRGLGHRLRVEIISVAHRLGLAWRWEVPHASD